MSTDANCCESILITCFASCLEMWDVIWEMRFRFVSCLKLFKTIRSRDHAWSSHRQFFWSSSLTFDEWRMLILDYRVTYVCSRLVERRLWWDVIKLDETSHQSRCERLIKLDESDSSNLMSENVISSNLTKAAHLTWRKKRYLIKSNDRVISSNFWKDRRFSLAESHLLCRIDVCVKLLW